MSDEEGSGWRFLTNHGAALLYIASSPDTTLREVAAAVGITERAAARIVKELRDGGYVTAERIGRRNTYTLHVDAPLRHPLVAGRDVRALLDALTEGGVTAK